MAQVAVTDGNNNAAGLAAVANVAPEDVVIDSGPHMTTGGFVIFQVCALLQLFYNCFQH